MQKNRTHRLFALALTAALAVSLTACGSNQSSTGSVSTNGSTSMDKVVGALNEQFMLDNQGIKVT